MINLYDIECNIDREDVYLLTRIADLCVQASETIADDEEKIAEILNQCDKLADMIDEYIKWNIY